MCCVWLLFVGAGTLLEYDLASYEAQLKYGFGTPAQFTHLICIIVLIGHPCRCDLPLTVYVARLAALRCPPYTTAGVRRSGPGISLRMPAQTIGQNLILTMMP